MADDDWVTSSEGDLDPDLTEEAGYAGWEAPDRSGWRRLQTLVIAVLLLVSIGGALLILLPR